MVTGPRELGIWRQHESINMYTVSVMNEVTTYKVERQGKANKSATSLSMHVCINSSAGSLLNACITRVVAFVCQQTLGDNSGIWSVGIPLMQSYVQHPYPMT